MRALAGTIRGARTLRSLSVEKLRVATIPTGAQSSVSDVPDVAEPEPSVQPRQFRTLADVVEPIELGEGGGSN